MLTVMTTFTTTVCSPRTKPAQIVLIKYRKIYVFLHCSRISLQFFFLPVIDILNPELKRGKCTSFGASTSDHDRIYFTFDCWWSRYSQKEQRKMKRDNWEIIFVKCSMFFLYTLSFDKLWVRGQACLFGLLLSTEKV